MKPSSMSLWSIGLVAAALVPTSGAEAWWRDRAYLDDGYVIESYPPGYLEDRPVLVDPRYGYERRVVRRPRQVFVEPDLYDDPALYDDNGDGGYGPDGDAVPDRRRGTMMPPPRRRDSPTTEAALPRDPLPPRVVPGLAPRKPAAGGPRIVTVNPKDLGNGDGAAAPRPPGVTVVTPPIVKPKVATPKVATPKVAKPNVVTPTLATPATGTPGPAAPDAAAETKPDTTASIALPVPRPNLEGMDFAPAKPNAALNLPQDEERR
jgi:hypothetical protein